MDISELIIQVKNTNDAVNEIKKVTNALNQTGKTAATVGKGLFAAWSFTKVIQGAKLLGNAFKDVLTTFRNFEIIYGKLNNEANIAVRTLTTSFQETERSAKKLLSAIGTRTLEFRYDRATFTKLNSDIAYASENIAAFMQIDPTEVANDLTRSLYGMTKSLQKYGLVVDQNSDSFKKQVEEIKLLKGETEEGAKALAIWNIVSKQMKKFDGAAKNQQKTLSFAIDNLTNTLKSGAFAKAGEILSNIFVPILDKINNILSNDWVSKIGGIVIALGGMLIAFKTITVAVKSLQLLLASFKLASLGLGALSSIGPSISGVFSGLIAKVSTGLAAGLTAISAAIAGWPVALTAAVIGVLVLAGTMIVNKLTVGDWFDFNGMTKAVLNWFAKLSDKIKNAFVHGKFQTNKEIAQSTLDSIRNTINNYQKTFTQINKEFWDFKGKIKTEDLSYVSNASKEALDKLIQSYQKNLNDYNKSQDTITRLETEISQRVSKMKGMRDKTSKAYKEEYDSYLLMLKEKLRFAENSQTLAQNGQLISEKVKITYQNLILENERIKLLREQEAQEIIERAKYVNSVKMSWLELVSSLKNLSGSMTKADKIKDIKEKINLLRDALQIKDLSEKDRVSYLQQIAEKEKQIVQIEMDNLNKEYDILNKTNEMLMDYAKDAMKFKARGVSGIKVGTMEDYKFITSSLGNVSAINQALNSNTQMSIQLDQKRNDILNKANQELNGIRTEINKIISKNNTQVIAAI